MVPNIEKPSGISDRRVRREARRIVENLDRRVEAVQTALGCVALLSPLLLFSYFWKIQELLWWRAALWTIGSAFALIFAVGLLLVVMENRLAARAARRFDLRFPDRSPHRPLAEAVLADVEPRSDAVKRFLGEIVTPGAPPSGVAVLAESERSADPVEPPDRWQAPESQAIPLELPRPRGEEE